jgi:ubiquinone/menaquinone biosynthesis C-methylase UbiE
MTHRHPDPVGDTNRAVNRAVLEARFRDPACPHGALQLAAMAELSSEPLAGKHVLDYNSGTAEFGIWMATEFAEVYLLDPSPANIALGLDRAQSSGVARRVKAIHLTNPATLDMFADSAFDLVFTRTPLAEIAHAPGALDEIARILKPGAQLVLAQEGPIHPSCLALIERMFAESDVRRVNRRKGWLSILIPSPPQSIIVATK